MFESKKELRERIKFWEEKAKRLEDKFRKEATLCNNLQIKFSDLTREVKRFQDECIKYKTLYLEQIEQNIRLGEKLRGEDNA